MPKKNIPEDAVSTYEKIKDSLKGENYTYESYDVIKVADTDRGKIRVAMKVYVPQAERVTAAANIQEALGEVDVTVTVKDETQLDVMIDDLGRKIRLDVKPDSKKGSGGGSEATRIQEGAQCVYTAIRFYKGEVDQISEEDLQFGMDKVDAPGLKIEEIQSLPKVWKESSMRGADKIYKDVKERGAPTDYEFVRGDKYIDDGAIKKAFLRVKNQTNIKSEDKWNPADIWLVRKKKKADIIDHLNSETTIDCLNNAIQQLLGKGDLIGISLKKIEGSPKLKLLNATSPATRRKNEASYYAKYDLTFDNKRRTDKNEGYPMDCYFMYSSSGTKQNGSIQVRNFAGAFKGDWKLEVKGVSAAQGKIQGEVTRRLLSEAGYDITGFTEPPFSACKPIGERSYKESITTEIYNLLKKYKAKGFVEGQETMNIIATRSQSYRYSKLASLRMLDWFENLDKEDANQAMKEIYLYASSQSDKSSVYYKLE